MGSQGCGSYNFKIHFGKPKISVDDLLKQDKDPDERVCRLCGKSFELSWIARHREIVNSHPLNAKQYCSRDCAIKAQRLKWKIKRLKQLQEDLRVAGVGVDFEA